MLNSQQQQHQQSSQYQQQQQQQQPLHTTDNGNNNPGYFIFDDLSTALQDRSINEQTNVVQQPLQPSLPSQQPQQPSNCCFGELSNKKMHELMRLPLIDHDHTFK